MNLPTFPGLAAPDGRTYPHGLIRAWRANLPDNASFPVALKIRQTFANGWKLALAEALTSGVQRIHIALIPKWGARGTPDWQWLSTTARAVEKLLPAGPPVQVFMRLGNYRDGKEEGCSFHDHAILEAEFGAMLAESSTYLSWAVGDDRGMVAAVKGWVERAAIYGEHRPVMLEVQAYMETGLSEDHPALLRDALYRNGWVGSIALVECHRWFKPQDQYWADFTRLFTAETGEALLNVHRACTAQGIGFMLYTGDTAFEGLEPSMPLNDAGRAILNRKRIQVKPWRPNRVKSWWQGRRLASA